VHQTQLVCVFFESAVTPNTLWMNLRDLDFSAKTGNVMKLDLGINQSNVHTEKVAKEFKVSVPFDSLWTARLHPRRFPWDPSGEPLRCRGPALVPPMAPGQRISQQTGLREFVCKPTKDSRQEKRAMEKGSSLRSE